MQHKTVPCVMTAVCCLTSGSPIILFFHARYYFNTFRSLFFQPALPLSFLSSAAPSLWDAHNASAHLLSLCPLLLSFLYDTICPAHRRTSLPRSRSLWDPPSLTSACTPAGEEKGGRREVTRGHTNTHVSPVPPTRVRRERLSAAVTPRDTPP